MLLCEIKSTVPYTWTEKSNDAHGADFMIGDNFYHMQFLSITPKGKEPFWVVEFQLLNGKTTDEYGNVGYGDEDVGNSPTVFGIVVKLTKEWLSAVNPTYFKFEAKTPKRSVLYRNLLNRIKQPNWKITQNALGNSTSFEVRIQNSNKKRFKFF